MLHMKRMSVFKYLKNWPKGPRAGVPNPGPQATTRSWTFRNWATEVTCKHVHACSICANDGHTCPLLVPMELCTCTCTFAHHMCRTITSHLPLVHKAEKVEELCCGPKSSWLFEACQLQWVQCLREGIWKLTNRGKEVVICLCRIIIYWCLF